MTNGWESVPGFGTAERLTWEKPGRFYSHQYDTQGKCDVMNAAVAFFKDNAESDAQREVADFLLTKKGAHTDWWGYGGDEQWVVDSQHYLDTAKELLDHLRTNKVSL